MSSRPSSAPTVISAAGIYIMSVIGAGFASGQEIHSFFFVYGPLGILGSLAAGLLLVWYGHKAFVLGCDCRADLNFYCGKYFSQILCILFGIFSAAMLTVMISCMNILNSTGQRPGLPAVLLSCLICYVSLLGGSGFLNLVGKILSPLMTVGIIALCGYTVISKLLLCGFDCFELFPMHPTSELPPLSSGNFLISALLYVGYNCLSTFPALFAQGALFSVRKKASSAGCLGGSVLAFLLIFLTFSLYVLQTGDTLPLLAGITDFNPVAGRIYGFILYAAVYTSAISLLYGLTELLRPHMKTAVSGSVICILCGLLSLLGFKSLIDVIYPFFGYIGAAFIVFILVRKSGATKKNTPRLK